MYIKEMNILLFPCSTPQRPEKNMRTLIITNKIKLIQDNCWCVWKIENIESNQSATATKMETMVNCIVNCRTLIREL